MCRIFFFTSLFLLEFWSLLYPASAQNLKLIQDTEIEERLHTFAAPILEIADLKSSSVKIYIVNDDSLNAFVAGGQKIFINTGLILRSDSANQIIGVIAHEAGHISGGHLSRVSNLLSKSSTSSILGAIIGGAAVIATGRGDIGAAILTTGQTMAKQNVLAYSRTQEGAADHAALSFLENTRQSARGLMRFMRILENQDLLSVSQQDPYARSHPLSRDRIAAIEHHIANSQFSDIDDTKQAKASYSRIKAKLFAYLRPYKQTIQTYPKTNKSMVARYARAIAEFRRSNLDNALLIMDNLIKEMPTDPYFQEMKGQMLFEHGRMPESLLAYNKAAKLLPEAHYIRRDLARVQIEMGTKYLDLAIKNLDFALLKDRGSIQNWRLLAIACGRNGNLPRSYLALGEEALLKQKYKMAQFQANRAKKSFAKGSREWLQAEDIEMVAKTLARKKKLQSTRK